MLHGLGKIEIDDLETLQLAPAGGKFMAPEDSQPILPVLSMALRSASGELDSALRSPWKKQPQVSLSGKNE